MRHVNKRGRVAWLVCLAILLAWSGLAMVAGIGSDDQYKAQQKQAAKEIHFYREVAGTDNDRGGMLNKLALDLRHTRADQLYQFRGDANKYGGIANELGFDPFNGASCSECGPLDEDVRANVAAVKAGNLGAVLSDIAVKKPDTMAAPPLALWILLLLLIPAVVLFERMEGSRKRSRQVRAMPNEMALIDDMDRALGGTFSSPQERYDLQALRNRLMEEVDDRVRYGEMAGHDMRIKELRQEALDNLEAIEEGNKVLESN